MGTVRHVMIFDAPLERVYASWLDPGRLASAFDFVESASADADAIVLEYSGLLGKRRTLELHITECVAERCLAWRAPEGLGITGSLNFDARGAQTYVTFVLGWRPPLGRLGDIVGGWLKYPSRPLEDGLTRLAEISKTALR